MIGYKTCIFSRIEMRTKPFYFGMYVMFVICLVWLVWVGPENPLKIVHMFIMERQNEQAMAQCRKIAGGIQEARIVGITNIYVWTVVEIRIVIKGEVGTMHDLERLRAIIARIRPSVPVSMQVSIKDNKSVYSMTNNY